MVGAGRAAGGARAAANAIRKKSRRQDFARGTTARVRAVEFLAPRI